MARTKTSVTDTRASPPPAQLPVIAPSDQVLIPASSEPVVASAENRTCQHCNATMGNMSIEDFESHVSTCSGISEFTITPHSGTMTSSLSPPPKSPVALSTSNTPTHPTQEVEAVAAVPKDLPADAEELPTEPKDLVDKPNSDADAGHQADSDEESAIEDDYVSETSSISPYIWDERVFYDSDEDEEASAVDVASRRSSVSSKGSAKFSAKNSARSSAKSSRKSSAALSDAEDSQNTLDPNGAQSVQASQSSNKSRSSRTPTDADLSQPSQNSEIPDVVVIEVFANSETPKVWKSILKNSSVQGRKPTRSGSMSRSARSGSIPKSVRSGSIPRSVRSGSVPQVTPMRRKKKPASSKQGFPKLTPIEAFEEYLGKPEELSYEQLYHRTAVVSSALALLQDEYDTLDKKTDDYDSSKKFQAKMAAEAKKEQDDKEAAETDAILLRLHAQYREEVKQPLRDYNNWLDQLQATSNPEATPPGYWEYMKQIKNPEVMSKVHKRRRQLEKQEAKPTHHLEDTPLPALRKGDEEVRKRRNILVDPVVFEDRKTADVYMADYSKHKDAIGYQVLKDRRAIVVTEEKDENGRPKRSRGKRAYDTEQTTTPGGSDSEEAPLGKRRRTARVVQDLPTSPARRRTATREGSPKVSVFPKSGKRIGRPPKARGEALPPVPKSASKSKLQQSHLPPVSEPAQSSDSEDELVNVQTPRELEPNEEAQLQEAAEALVQQTQAAAVVPAKPKHAGGRPKKIILNVKSGDEATEVKASPKKGGRAAAKPKATRVGRAKKEVEAPIEQVQLGEENDVMQSTEQDDESRFASASTSRPTTSSSAMTTSTGRPSRAASRAATREMSAQATAQGPSTGKGRGGKRKRVVENGTAETTQPAGPVPKKRKNVAKKQETIPEVDVEQPVTPEATGEAVAEDSLTASGRPKRKKAAVLADSIYVALPGDGDDFALDDESEPPPQKRRKGGKAARSTRKAKALKEEATESEYFSEAVEDVPPRPKKHMIRFGPQRKVIRPVSEELQAGFEISDQSAPESSRPRASKGKGKGKEVEQYTSEDAGHSPAANGIATPHQGSEIPSGLQTGDETDGLGMNYKTASQGGKSKAGSYTPNFESGAEQSGHDGDGEEGGLSAAQEEARKKAQKSRKLAEATRERWAKGLMKGPMEKRAATNAAKKAAKDAAKGGVPNGGVPASSFTPNPFFSVPPNPSQPMTFDNPPTFAAAPQNPFSNPTANTTDVYASLDAIAYHGAPPPLSTTTTFVPVTVAPSNTASRKPRAPAKKRKTTAQASKSNDIAATASSSQQTPIQQAALTSNASTSATNTSASASISTATPAPTRGSTRVRKPTRLAMGMDGAGDDEDSPHQFRSEYERYQALTSPRSPLTLGKRKRKAIMDLSAMEDDDDDDFS
ncbi:hypothetical protein BKA64DRAFT_668423 [Cadophora sp. MPI-SDFR-AT-0126]|nr:hypothetical protein BKA64DRAFT_668423 [Leotiomycetes sp. MPI-SDFR-AT-0126]